MIAHGLGGGDGRGCDCPIWCFFAVEDGFRAGINYLFLQSPFEKEVKRP